MARSSGAHRYAMNTEGLRFRLVSAHDYYPSYVAKEKQQNTHDGIARQQPEASQLR